jgi:Dual specificity phosphatase, catalytic domain
MTEIVENLFLGCEADSRPGRVESYHAVVNCSKKIPNHTIGEQVFVRVLIDDTGESEDSLVLERVMPELCPQIDDWLSNGKRVLVHCRMAQSRSCTVIAAYLTWKHALTSFGRLEDVVAYIQAKERNAFCGGMNFERFLRSWFDHVVSTRPVESGVGRRRRSRK